MMKDFTIKIGILTGRNLDIVKADIPDGVVAIGDHAFDNCKHLESINIPDSVTSIGASAFKNCGNLTINCNQGSYAEEYAKKNYILYKITD